MPRARVGTYSEAELIASGAWFIQNQTNQEKHDIAVVLGSGWAKTSEHIGDRVTEFPSSEVPGLSKSGVPGHSGSILSIRQSNGKSVLVMGARTHLYEGRGVDATVRSIRLAAACGAQVMILTNGAGGIKETWVPGTPVLISDHINLTGVSPLEGPTFVDLTDLYSVRLRDLARSVSPNLEEGVYVQFRGPNYETPAEVQMAKTIGGHIVGMSTAIEAIAAREAGMEVLGLSLITNLAAGISSHALSHQEVIESGKAAEPVISKLLADVIRLI